MKSAFFLFLMVLCIRSFSQEIDNSKKNKKAGVIATKEEALTPIDKKVRVLPGTRYEISVTIIKKPDQQYILKCDGTASPEVYRIDKGDSSLQIDLEKGPIWLTVYKPSVAAPGMNSTSSTLGWEGEFLVDSRSLAQLKEQKIVKITFRPRKGHVVSYMPEESKQDFVKRAIELVEKTVE